MGYTPKKLSSGPSGRQKLINGINKMANAVGSTMGPMGKTVIIESEDHTRGMTVTKDGVTVAKSIDLLDPVENIAVRMLKDAAIRTATDAGDAPQPLTAKVLTPKGFVKMGDLKVGDEVCGTNGTIQKVLGVYPKGKLKAFKLKTDDGRETLCSEDHYWTVISSINGGVKKTITTRDLIKSGKISYTQSGLNRHRFYLPQTHVDFYEDNLCIDPYTLGLLIGDGSLSGTGSVELSIGKNKEHIIDKIILPEGITKNVSWVENKNYFRIKIVGKSSEDRYIKDYLNDLGLFGVKSCEKFIPHKYLYSSLKSRKELLKGLSDTDGYINPRGLLEYSTCSKRLAKDVVDLLRGLGETSSVFVYEEGSGYSTDNVNIRVSQRKGYKNGLKIVSIEDTNEYHEMMCIKVSNEDHLYYTDDYIPTHNTTCATVLAQALVNKGSDLLTDGVDRTTVIRHIVRLKDYVIDKLKEMSIEVTDDDLKHVATISANNDPHIGEIIAGVYKQVGRDGIVAVDKSKTSHTYAEVTDGIKIDRGYASEIFINKRSEDTCEFENAHVLVCDAEISNVMQIEPVLAHVVQNNKPLLIIAPTSPAFNATIAANVVKRGMKFCIIQPPNFGYKQHELMEDIAFAVGATYFSEKTGDDLSVITPQDLGVVKKVIAKRDQTILMRDNEAVEDAVIEERVNELKEAHKLADNKKDKDFIDSRIASLKGGIGVIYAGGSSDIEQKELYDRIEDAVCSVRSSIDMGILPGGGVALYSLISSIKIDEGSEEELMAIEIIEEAMEEPLYRILENADIDYDSVYDAESDLPTYGYDVKSGQVVNMIEAGIVDPTKAIISAFENAVSVATTILSTDSIVTLARDVE